MKRNANNTQEGLIFLVLILLKMDSRINDVIALSPFAVKVNDSWKQTKFFTLSLSMFYEFLIMRDHLILI